VNKVDIYLCGHKGAACATVIAEKFADCINTAIVENDSTLKVNPYQEMVKTLQAAGIKVSSRIGKEPAEVAIAVGWRRLIRHEYEQLVILHDSLLPKYRGWNPLLTALMNEDREIGVTALLGNSEVDSGPIILQKKAAIEYPIRLERAIAMVSQLSAEAVSKILTEIRANKKLKGKKQDESKATYSIWRDEQDFRIDWNQPAEKILRHIDSTSTPYAGASALLAGKLVKIERAELWKIKPKIVNPTPGKIWQLVSGEPIVICKSGFLRITELRDASGKNMLPLTKLRQRFE
jgi:methionyl-tRNA formyltransferase